MKKPKPHRLAWFINRTGKEVIKNDFNLFNAPVKIESQQHARALYITQIEKGYRYVDLKDFNQ